MTGPIPITGQELEEMKERCLAAPTTVGSPLAIAWGGRREKLRALSVDEATRLDACLSDLPRLIAEVERLNRLMKTEGVYVDRFDT